MSGSARFEFVDSVTSDLSFVAWGGTLEELFAAAAEALLAATLENPDCVGSELRRSLSLEEPDLDLLLLSYLNELVYLRDAEHLLLRPRDLRVSRDGGARLEAQLVGEAIRPERHRLAGDVKAATAYGLEVSPVDSGWRATVTLDV